MAASGPLGRETLGVWRAVVRICDSRGRVVVDPGDPQEIMNSAIDANLRKRNLRTIGALAAVFFLPLVASFYMYYASDWRPAASVANGELYQPARPLPKV